MKYVSKEKKAPPVEEPEIGQTVSFYPAAFSSGDGALGKTPTGPAPSKVTGEIVEVNAAHRWYRARYECFGSVLFECFKY